MAYTVTLYTNSSDPNEMNKSIALVGTASCDIKSQLDIENPVIDIMGGSYTNVNYVYIEHFKRYYYAKYLGGTSNRATFECQSDPLMSFKAGILSSPAVIEKNSWHYDKYIPDGDMPVESRTVRSTFVFPNNPFSGTDNCYVLTTIGSGAE